MAVSCRRIWVPRQFLRCSTNSQWCNHSDCRLNAVNVRVRTFLQRPNYKKILRLSYDVIITYDNRKLLSHRKIIVRFSRNQAPGFHVIQKDIKRLASFAYTYIAYRYCTILICSRPTIIDDVRNAVKSLFVSSNVSINNNQLVDYWQDFSALLVPIFSAKYAAECRILH